MSLRYQALTGAAIDAVIDGLAALRIRVFHDWPYLYAGDLGYERGYLAVYRDNPRAIVAAAFDGDRLVGAATGLPMVDADPEFRAAFEGTDHNPEQIFYCAESVLLPDYRGQGAGHRFFDLREQHARALGLRFAAFCSVKRPEDHPARPHGYRPLDGFWRKRGYAPLPGVVAQFTWRDLGDATDTAKPLQVWMRAL
ncbi:MAG: putative acetyltransferase [Roseibaca calidilacus]|uniref:Acetyltransferase (GNAT) family n=1 Tax=Roseibaca calidilacus TaxID=1666912 RepID=A0A0P7YML0_9RHOB|nr:GNAT family N-acetyltransferase [Roseibaca calidilacus]KPP89796.1 MAG: putative acetyltransferase [Roseibaca calidilacus]CUX80771.1 Acetyltransferase (GNAT) family [Roseibaca calidilacus]